MIPVYLISFTETETREKTVETPLYVKSIGFRLEPDNRLDIQGLVCNRAGTSVPPLRLYISLHDRQNLMIGRVGASLPQIGPLETRAFEAATRLRAMAFFTVQFRLEKLQDVDYSDFDFALHQWGTRRNTGTSGGLST